MVLHFVESTPRLINKGTMAGYQKLINVIYIRANNAVS